MGRHGIGTSRAGIFGKVSSVVAALAMVVTGAVVVPALAASAEEGGAQAAAASDPTPSWDDVCLADGNPNIYVGGDFTTPGFNEVGSPFVVNGNATFNGGGAGYNGVGAATGSETWPASGEVALRVGGNFTGTADVRGHSSPTDVKVRIGGTNSGTVTTSNDVQANLGSATALGQFASWKSGGVLDRAAQYYLTTPTTPGNPVQWESWGALTFTGSNAQQQSFTIDSSQFQNGKAWDANFVSMSSSNFIIIKVTGDNPNINLNSVAVDGSQPANILDPKYMGLAKRIVWVFPDATNITFSGVGQIPGSFIAPKANVKVNLASGGLNGRLWAGGNVAFEGVRGWEIHLFGILSCPQPPVDVNPVAPSITQATCDVNSNIVDPVVTATNTAVITYSGIPANPTAGQSFTVTATIPNTVNAKFPDTLPSGWVRTGDRTATYAVVLAAPNCAPQSPTATAQQCNAAGDPLEPTVTLPANGNGITYSKSVTPTANGWTVTVTATAVGTVVIAPATGWVIVAGGKSATWTQTITAADCGLAPAEPTVTESQCDADGLPTNPVVTLPVDGNGIKYTKSGSEVPGGTVVVTAKIDNGVAKKFPASLGGGWVVSDQGKTATKTIVLDTPTCSIPQLTNPAATDSQCTPDGVPSNPTVTRPADTAQITYTQSGDLVPGGTVVITATAKNGFTFPATVGGDWVRVSDTVATWTKTFGTPDCSINPVAPTVTEAQCLAYGQVQDPTLGFDTSNGVTYQLTSGTVGAGNAVTVTATAPAGKSFPATVSGWTVAQGGRTATWTHTYQNIDCTVPLTALPQADQVICAADGTQTDPALTVPTNGGGITYTYDTAKVKAGETVIVTATLDSAANKRFGTLAGGWVLDPASNGQVATWTFAFADPDCSTTVVPLTVDEATCAADGAVNAPVITGLPASGTDANGVTYVVTGTVAAGQKVTVTATAPNGKKFTSVPQGWTIQPGGKTATWEHTFGPVDCSATPVAPQITDAQCSAVGDVTTPSVQLDTTGGITYQITAGSLEPGKTVTVTATAPSGKRFNTLPAGWQPVAGNPQQATWTSAAFSTPNCLVSPVLPTVDDVQCTALGDPSAPNVTVPVSVPGGIQYVRTGDVEAGKKVTVTATAPANRKFDAATIDPTWVLSNGDRTATWEFTFANPDCAATLTLPTADQVQCLASGDQSVPAVHVAADTADVEYTQTGSVAAGGTVYVTATIKAGVSKRFPATVPGWTVAQDGKTATWQFTYANPNCSVTPVTPVAQAAQCDADGNVTQAELTGLPAADPADGKLRDANGTVYVVSGAPAPGATVTVTATAADGVKFPSNLGADWTVSADGKTATWTHVFDNIKCDDLTPVAPAVQQSQCDADGNPTAPAVTWTDTAEITYSADPAAPKAGDKVTVTATVKAGVAKRFPVTIAGWTVAANGKSATTEIQLSTPNCDAPQPVSPAVQQAQCSVDGYLGDPTVTLPADTAVITYSTSNATPKAGDTVTVTATIVPGSQVRFPATLADGWVPAADGLSATKDITLTADTCDVKPVDPTVQQAQCDAVGDLGDPTVTLPADNQQIHYTTSNQTPKAGDTVTITATAQAGYQFNQAAIVGAGWTWVSASVVTKDITLSTRDCAVQLAQPQADQVQCNAAGDQTVPSVSKPADTAKIVYVQTGEVKAGKTVTITATAQAGFVFDPATLPADWTITAGSNNTEATWTFSFADPDCSVAPTLPTADQVQCLASGDQSVPAVHVAADTADVEYTQTGSVAAGGTVTVTATIKAGVTKRFPATVAGWTVAQDGKSATWQFTFANPDCSVTPVTPQATVVQCDADGNVTQAAISGVPAGPDANGTTYVVSGTPAPGATVTVTATAANGVKFPSNLGADWTVSADGKTATWTHVFDQVTCDDLTPVAPAVQQSQCDADGNPTAPAVTWTDTAEIAYSTSNATPKAGDTVTITATVKAGVAKRFPATIAGWTVAANGKSATIDIPLSTPNCDAPQPVSPTVQQAQCSVDGNLGDPTVTLPADTAVITYSTSNATPKAGDTVTVTATIVTGSQVRFPATLADGWVPAADGLSATKVITLTVQDCAVPAPALPQADEVQCNATGDQTPAGLTVPATTAQIVYSTSGDVKAGGTAVVTATAQPGYYFDPATLDPAWTITAGSNNTVATWTYTFANPDCAKSPVTPTVVDVQCTPAGSQTVPTVTVPADGNGITYQLVGAAAPGAKVQVIAHAGPGVFFQNLGATWDVSVDGKTATWSHTFGNPTCTPPVTTTPPTTPTSSTVTPAIDGTQCINVSDVNEITVTTVERDGIVYTVRGNGSGKVTITATAKDGFELSTPAGWTRNGNSATITITPASDGVICVAGESSVVPSASTSVTVVQPSVEVQGENNEIAYTGVNTMGLLSIALLLLGGGAIILGFGTRRRESKRQH